METPKETSTCLPSEKNSLLISEVKKFPSLYDTSDPNYYVLSERNKAWLQVATNCDEPAERCHLRWKSLRKRFAKEKRRIPEILHGQRRPWALFPKMSFLTPSVSNRRIKSVKSRRKSVPSYQSSTSTDSFKQNASDDDMLIVDANDEIVRTCKSVDISEDEYIYDTLDDPDSALEIIRNRPASVVKPTAIRSGGSAGFVAPALSIGSKRIRRLTPKMQNSIIAKKLKQAQQVLQQSNLPNTILNKKPPTIHNARTQNKKSPVKNNRIQNDMIENKNHPVVNSHVPDKTVLYQDKTTRHVATVNPNIIRIEKIMENEDPSLLIRHNNKTPPKVEPETTALEGNRQFKVIKLKGRNPIIFSPEQLPDIQSLLKSETSPIKEQNDLKSPTIKVKSVDNLNSQSTLSSSNNINDNLDIIHSVGLVRKPTAGKSTGMEKTSHQSYSRSYSWNRPATKFANRPSTTEKIQQPDSQTNDYEIEETWNDIKEENIDDDTPWPHPPDLELPMPHEGMVNNSYPDTLNKVNMWNRLNEAKLELVAYQRKLLEEQHKKNLEYMKKEHDLKMTVLKAEIDLKRKQLNIML